MTTSTPQHAIADAIAKAGGRSALMRRLNARGWSINSPSVLFQWERNGAPAKYCPDIEAETGVDCEALCPEFPWGRVRDRRRASYTGPDRRAPANRDAGTDIDRRAPVGGA